jgi:hypothetical protein
MLEQVFLLKVIIIEAGICGSEILRNVEWLFRTDVSGPVGCPETSVRNCNSTLCKILEDFIFHLHGGRSLKSRSNIGSVAKKTKFSTKGRHM